MNTVITEEMRPHIKKWLTELQNRKDKANFPFSYYCFINNIIFKK